MIKTDKDIVMFELNQDPEQSKKELEDLIKQNESLTEWPFEQGA